MNGTRRPLSWVILLAAILAFEPGFAAPDEDLPKPEAPAIAWPSNCTPDPVADGLKDNEVMLSQGKTHAPGAAGYNQKTLLPAKKTTRIGVWGDSHTASGDFMGAALAQWGIEKQEVRPGYIAPAFQVAGVGLAVKKHCLSPGWVTTLAHREPKAMAEVTQSLMALSADRAGAVAWIDFRHPDALVRLQQLHVHYAQRSRDRSLVLGVSVDGAPEQLFVSDSELPFVLNIQARKPFATIGLRLIAGQIHLLGFEPVYAATPKWQVDTFSVPGALSKVWGETRPRLIGAPYDVAIYQYGTNEAMTADFVESEYADGLRKNLSRFRALNPRAKCILIGPPDRGGTTPTANRPYAEVHASISHAQAQVAKEYNCQAWNWQSTMQKKGNVRELLTSSPPWMGADLVHLTKDGYEKSGALFATSVSVKK